MKILFVATSKNSNKVVQETSPQGRRHKEDENSKLQFVLKLKLKIKNI